MNVQSPLQELRFNTFLRKGKGSKDVFDQNEKASCSHTVTILLVDVPVADLLGALLDDHSDVQEQEEVETW